MFVYSPAFLFSLLILRIYIRAIEVVYVDSGVDSFTPHCETDLRLDNHVPSINFHFLAVYSSSWNIFYLESLLSQDYSLGNS